MQKLKIIDYVHCPMRKFWRLSLRLFEQNNVRISKNFCLLKKVECGQMFLLTCQQLRKKGQHNFIEENYGDESESFSQAPNECPAIQ